MVLYALQNRTYCFVNLLFAYKEAQIKLQKICVRVLCVQVSPKLARVTLRGCRKLRVCFAGNGHETSVLKLQQALPYLQSYASLDIELVVWGFPMSAGITTLLHELKGMGWAKLSLEQVGQERHEHTHTHTHTHTCVVHTHTHTHTYTQLTDEHMNSWNHYHNNFLCRLAVIQKPCC